MPEASGLSAPAETAETAETVETADTQRAAVRFWRERWRNQPWIDRAARDDDEPWSLPLVVRVEKARPPDHDDAMTAAALAVVRLLAHPASAPDGPWHAVLERWMDGRIRKVVRRARGARWTDILDLPGGTAEVAGTEVRALLPHPVAEVPPLVSKLQVQGLDLDSDAESGVDRSSPPVESAAGPVLSIVLAPGVRMSTGKACAQVGHAAQLGMLQLDEDLVFGWLGAGFPVRIVAGSTREWNAVLQGEIPAAVVQDAGYTEVEPGTQTCAATFAAVTGTSR
ncbi:peptidyl-tRNA hydrolase [Actinopolymorpha alba]|uniref:peptidyl-tRNA hydrolase n=1 Tax=Actinopolymorpha alba TaxID=533267 RepID=UPI0003702D54|nr:peptidyl-tRNA hydrolase [Actinopolymorpha alba]